MYSAKQPEFKLSSKVLGSVQSWPCACSTCRREYNTATEDSATSRALKVASYEQYWGWMPVNVMLKDFLATPRARQLPRQPWSVDRQGTFAGDSAARCLSKQHGETRHLGQHWATENPVSSPWSQPSNTFRTWHCSKTRLNSHITWNDLLIVPHPPLFFKLETG